MYRQTQGVLTSYGRGRGNSSVQVFKKLEFSHEFSGELMGKVSPFLSPAREGARA